MRKKLYKTIFVVLLTMGMLAIAVAMSMNSLDQKENSNNLVQKGYANLSGIHLDSSKIVPLNGNWSLYWNQHILPSNEDAVTQYYPVPRIWGNDGQESVIKRKGSATYRLQMKLPKSNEIYSLYIPNIRMASKVFVNGKEVGSSGNPSLSIKSYAIENIPYTVYFTAPKGDVDLVIWTSNFAMLPKGGIAHEIHFGTAEAIEKYINKIRVFELAVILMTLSYGFYHLVLFVSRREREYVYTGFISVCTSIGMSLNNQKFLMVFLKGFAIEEVYKLQIYIVYAILVFIILFIDVTFQDVLPSVFKKLIISFNVMAMMMMIFASFDFAMYVAMYAGILEILFYLLILSFLLYEYVSKFKEMVRNLNLTIFILTFMAVICSYLNFMFMNMGNIALNNFTNLGFLFFTLGNVLILSRHFSKTYKENMILTEQVIEQSRLKDQFLINTAHELQTPMNAVINISQGMSKELAYSKSKLEKDALLIQNITTRMTSLVNDMMDLEKIRQNRIELKIVPVDIHILCNLSIPIFDYSLKEKNIQLINEMDDSIPLVYGDEMRIRQIIYNLLSNSTKFTLNGKMILSANVEGEYLALRVIDSGLGIEKEKWERIFHPFIQLDGTYGGLGLGLSISRRLAELMNGSLQVESSEVNKGTTMLLKLPLVQIEKKHEIADSKDLDDERMESHVEELENEEEVESKPFTILAVDDEPANLITIQYVFKQQPYTIIQAYNGIEALEKLRGKQNYDLVILDVMMPKLSGFEVCKAIREHYSAYELPILMLTVKNDPHDVEEGLLSGANDFLSKPFDAGELKARVRNLLVLKQSVAQALRNEMAFLQSQIKPHFLYNALSTIMSLCYTDGEKAGTLIASLSQYLQKSFDLEGMEESVLINRELELTKAYLDIEKARFGDRLEILWDIDQTLYGEEILPLTIQPLVENAIRHGLMSRNAGGLVKISVQKTANSLFVSVEDNGVGMELQEKNKSLHTLEQNKNRLDDKIGKNMMNEENSIKMTRTGVGLQNIRKRLNHYYGEELKIESELGKGTKVSFILKGNGYNEKNESGNG